MSQAELGELVPCDKSTVSRVAASLTVPDEAFAVACDAAFPRMDGWFTRFYADSRGWGEAFPPAFRETKDYARAVLDRHPNTTRVQVQDRLVGRMAQQETLERENLPLVWVLLDENALHRDVGGVKIMHDQLCRLADMARRPNVTVQLISRVGAHPGLSGAFGIEELGDRHTVAYLETAADGQTAEDPATMAAVELRFDALRTEAFREWSPWS